MDHLWLAAVFVVWWAVSACNQFHAGKWTASLRKRLPFALIPLWTFFAPRPADSDPRLIWREERGGAWGAWQELQFGFAPFDRRWALNPEMVLNKALSDIASTLLQSRADFTDRTVLLSMAYLSLLHLVMDQPRAAGCSAVQFAVVRTAQGRQERRMKVVYLSEVHGSADVPAHVV